ncbi:hypothetical protein IIC68_02175, partial [archaeon]|nr:hypothetical protein [archaeon]
MRDIRSIFLIFIFIFPIITPFAGASSHDIGNDIDPRILTETPEETEAREVEPPITSQPETVPQITTYVCENSSLTGDETQGIIDLLKTGFTGKEIAGETEKNDEREELAANELVLQNPENEDEAVKAEIPNKKFKPWEISQFLNSYIKGPFAFGVVLEDSLRTGRCENYSSPDCTLTGRNLKFRNSGVGIIENLKPIREELGDFLDGNRNFSQFSKEENEVLRTALLTDNSVDAQGNITESQLKTVERLEKALIP